MSTQRRKKIVIATAVSLLVVLNVWRWWPSMPHALGGKSDAVAFRLEDLEVKALPSEAPLPLQRDLFHPKRPVVKPKAAVKPAPTAPPPPQKSPEELAHDAAQAAFAQIRCVGISVRDERIQAYLINGGEAILVSAGDKVGGRFEVEKIVPEAVTLRDPETGVGGKLGVSGK